MFINACGKEGMVPDFRAAICAVASAAMLLTLLTAQAQTPRESLNQYVSEIQKNPNDTVLREKIIQLARSMKPAPIVPKEAERFMIRGAMAVKTAKDANDYKDAVAEFEKATLAAPWLANAYYNLGIAQEKAGVLVEAMGSLKLYLLAAPDAADANNVEKLIIEIEYRQEKAAKQSSPEAIAEKKQNEFDAWLKKLDGRRYTCTEFRGALGVIDISGKVLVLGNIGPRPTGPDGYSEVRRLDIHGREISHSTPQNEGVFPVETIFMISEAGDRIIERRRFRDGHDLDFVYVWQR